MIKYKQASSTFGTVFRACYVYVRLCAFLILTAGVSGAEARHRSCIEGCVIFSLCKETFDTLGAPSCLGFRVRSTNCGEHHRNRLARMGRVESALLDLYVKRPSVRRIILCALFGVA